MLYLILSLATIGSGLITLLEPHGRSWVSIVMGVLQIAIGVALLATMLGVLTLVMVIQAIGVLAVAGGVAAIASALRSSNRAHAAVRPVGHGYRSQHAGNAATATCSGTHCRLAGSPSARILRIFGASVFQPSTLICRWLRCNGIFSDPESLARFVTGL
jgi:hypothetical protein